MKNNFLKILVLGIFLSFSQFLFATKLVEVKVVDKDHIMIYFLDGEISYVDNGVGTRAFTSSSDAADNALVTYGTALNTTNAATVGNWVIKSTDDANFGTAGKSPTNVYRKSKLSGVSQEAWNTSTNDFNYDWAYEHTIFLKLPYSMVQGKTYTIQINANINSDVTTKTFTYDIFNIKSEAIRINVAGYLSSPNLKSADVYMWMGDGGARDFTSFQGNKVYIYNTATSTSVQVGTLTYWKAAASEFTDGHQMIRSAVWNADFTSFSTPGTYRLAIEGIGCSENFTISADAYLQPFKVSTLGFYYMRIGQDSVNGIRPIPRRPLWIPNTSPTTCKVYITTMQPYHANWSSLCGGDKWDCKDEWAAYSTGRVNNNVYGGHSDALDWDRHLGHVPIIYDMLLPYFLSNGILSEDNLGIAESGNGIPDILDEARNEVDFWLRLRDGKGYSHGVNNPNGSNVLYQAGTTAVAAWANAANAAMLANCFQIAGKTALANQYRDSAVNAYNYANGLSDQMLDKMVDKFSGKDFKATAAAFLYNITGNTAYETMLNSLSSCTSTTSTIQSGTQNQLYAVAGYLFTKQPRNYPTLYLNMKASIIAEAKSKEANYSTSRPSRRASDNTQGWFVTEMAIQRTIIAHAIADPGADKSLFENALLLEADWTLGRNPLNMIQMTTATTALASKKSVPNAYTSGWNDGTPGVHPGHTPYMNIYDWGGTMAMGNPTWMTNKNYPTTNWPYGEMYYNVRYFYAANEFTPQQTMRGKQALYGYLHSISPAAVSGCATPNITGVSSICGLTSTVLQSGLTAGGKTFTWYKDGAIISGQTSPTLTITQAGTYRVSVDSNSCVKTSDKIVSGTLQLELGGNQNLCAQTEAVLDAGNSTVSNVSYLWNTGATTQTITVNKAGTYSVSVSALNCTTVSDNITITSSLLSVLDDTICSAGAVNLQIVGAASYQWFTQATGGTAVATGNTYSPTISSNTTYYAAEAGGVSGSLGKATVGTGSAWALGAADLGATDKINLVTVTQAITLESVAVYVVNNGTDVTINFKQGTTVIHTKTVSGLNSGKQTIPLNFLLQPGTYTIDAVGTSNSLTFEASGATYPYSYPGYISFTYNESWQSDWYGLFYDWKVVVGSSCARTPVKAIIDANNPSCTVTKTQTISLIAGWNLISYNVRPADSTIATIFSGKDVLEIKDANGFWSKNNAAGLQSLMKLTPGNGYLVKMNTGATISITGNPITEGLQTINSGWNLVGCRYQNVTPFSTVLNSSNCALIKNFDGFWIPGGSTNSITNFEPGKGYYLRK